MRKAALTLLFVGLASAASARDLVPVERICPIDGKSFAAQADVGGTMTCRRLDMKPVGDIAAPPELSVCPRDGVVVEREGLDPEEVDKIKAWVLSDAYKKLATESTYYRLAAIQERLGAAPVDVGFSYVAASWQVEADPSTCKRYLEKAIEPLERAAAPDASDAQGRTDAVMLLVEIERRLGRFDAAHKRLEAFKASPAANDETIKRVVALQLELVGKKDSGLHYLAAEGAAEDDCRAQDRASGAKDEPRLEVPVQKP